MISRRIFLKDGGLALVAQQAEIHGGTASRGTRPRGSARLLLKLAPPI